MKAAAAQRRPRAPQLVLEALCTAPATQKATGPQRRPRAPQLHLEALQLCLPREAAAAPAATTRAAARLGGSVYTAPATQKTAAALAATTHAAARLGGSVYCGCHAKGNRGPSGDHPRRSSTWRLCALRLPCKRQLRPQRQPRAPQLHLEALCTAPATAAAAATTRAAARLGGYVYCACHARGSRASTWSLCVLRLPRKAPAATTCAAARLGGSVYCACHAKDSRGPSGDHARRSSTWRLCVLRLPRERQPRPQRRPPAPQLDLEAMCIAPATQKATAAPAATTRAAAPLGGSVYILRLPRKRQPRPQRRPRAPQLDLEALCTVPATQKATAVQRRQRAPQLDLEALCTAPATQKAAAAPATWRLCVLRLPRSSVYCARHAKDSRGPSGDHARRSSTWRM